MPTKHVYFVRYSSKDEERPWIDFEIPQNGRNVPWLQYGKVLSGESPAEEYSPVHLVCNDPFASQWHSYTVAGTYGMLSKTAIDLIGPYMTRCFEFLEAWINDSPFYLLRRIGSIDCLDHGHSSFVMYPHDQERIMKVTQFRFFKALIPDPSVFVLPESKGGLFATDAVKRLLDERSLKGLYLSGTQ